MSRSTSTGPALAPGAAGRRGRDRSAGRRGTAFVLGAALLLLPGGASAAPPQTERVSVSSGERQANGGSGSVAMSADGRWIAFASDARNLVRGDTNLASDVFVRDRVMGTTRRISVSSTGKQGNEQSRAPSISADGRFVAFLSDASNLVPGDTNKRSDVFVRDLRLGTTTRVSVSGSERQARGDSFDATISADGRYIAFVSGAPNLVAGDTNERYDVFVRDRVAGTTSRVSVTSAGKQTTKDAWAPAISAHGRYVAFETDGKLVRGDANGRYDIYVRDRRAGRTTRASVSSAGGEGHANSLSARLSGDGRLVVFTSSAPDLVPDDENGAMDGFVRDLDARTTTRASVSNAGEEADGWSGPGSISASGRWIAFSSSARNLSPDKSSRSYDIFLLDRTDGTVRRLTATASTDPDHRDSFAPVVSADARFVAFVSAAEDLVADDTNGGEDVFVSGPLD